jgi:hypothetical protein
MRNRNGRNRNSRRLSRMMIRNLVMILMRMISTTNRRVGIQNCRPFTRTAMLILDR